jgi:hypothetical protein
MSPSTFQYNRKKHFGCTELVRPPLEQGEKRLGGGWTGVPARGSAAGRAWPALFHAGLPQTGRHDAKIPPASVPTTPPAGKKEGARLGFSPLALLPRLAAGVLYP